MRLIFIVFRAVRAALDQDTEFLPANNVNSATEPGYRVPGPSLFTLNCWTDTIKGHGTTAPSTMGVTMNGGERLNVRSWLALVALAGMILMGCRPPGSARAGAAGHAGAEATSGGEPAMFPDATLSPTDVAEAVASIPSGDEPAAADESAEPPADAADDQVVAGEPPADVRQVAAQAAARTGNENHPFAQRVQIPEFARPVPAEVKAQGEAAIRKYQDEHPLTWLNSKPLKKQDFLPINSACSTPC